MLRNIIFILLFWPSVAFAADLYQPAWRLHLVRDGKLDFLDLDLSQKIISDIFSTLKSTGYDSTQFVDAPKLWKRYLRETSLLVELDTPTPINILNNEYFTATDIVIPISQDEHYLLFNRHTREYRAITKFAPIEHAKLICRPELLQTKQRRNFELILANRTPTK